MSRHYPGVKKRPDGRYRVRVKARDPKTGRMKELKRVLNVASEAEAARAKQELRELFEAGSTAIRPRVADYAKSWLTTKLPSLKPSTAYKYAQVLDQHVLRAFEDHYVDAVSRDDIIAWREAQVGKPATINSRLRVLRTLFADATAELGLPRNPCARVKAVTPSFHDRPPNRLTAGQLARVLAALREHEPDRYPLFLTLAFTAARPGEATALTWDDIDFGAETIHIRRAHWKGLAGTTKTGASRRVPMLAPLADALKAHRRTLIERQAPGLEAGLVFPSSKGTIIRASALQKPLKRALKAAGIEARFTLQGFRRTFNNLLRQATTGEVVRSITGHVTERMTEHYSHIEPDEKRRAATDVLHLVYPPEGTSGPDGGTLEAGQEEGRSGEAP